VLNKIKTPVVQQPRKEGVCQQNEDSKNKKRGEEKEGTNRCQGGKCCCCFDPANFKSRARKKSKGTEFAMTSKDGGRLYMQLGYMENVRKKSSTLSLKKPFYSGKKDFLKKKGQEQHSNVFTYEKQLSPRCRLRKNGCRKTKKMTSNLEHRKDTKWGDRGKAKLKG